jgi:hypothetical protein
MLIFLCSVGVKCMSWTKCGISILAVDNTANTGIAGIHGVIVRIRPFELVYNAKMILLDRSDGKLALH